jgi:hypothetical protein
MSQRRIDYGSKLHLSRFLHHDHRSLDSMVLEQTRADAVDWLGCPLNSRKGVFDNEWRGLSFLKSTVGIPDGWSRFWPQRGNQQNWDAVAKLKFGSKDKWLLAEAKAHTSELNSYCRAKAGLPMIQCAFRHTKIVILG